MVFKFINEFADDKRKFENSIVFILILVFEIIFSFWLAEMFGYIFNAKEINISIVINFISSYQILIPVLSYLSIFLIVRVVIPVIFNLVGYKIFKSEYNTDNDFKELLSYYGIVSKDNTSNEKITVIDEMVEIATSSKGQNNMLNQSLLFFLVIITMFFLSFNYSLLFLIPNLILLCFFILHLIGFQAYRVMYMKRDYLKKLILEQDNENWYKRAPIYSNMSGL